MLFAGKQLAGHTSPETAYVVDDYPYGFRLRCKIRYWVETKKGYGQRFVSQTTNPKKAGEVWNKPKAGTYAPIVIMYQATDTGHVENCHVSVYHPDRFDEVSALELEPRQRYTLTAMQGAVARYNERKAAA